MRAISSEAVALLTRQARPSHLPAATVVEAHTK